MLQSRSRQKSAQKTPKTVHEARLKYNFERQVSLINRVEQVRKSAAKKIASNENLSPSQRDRIIEEEVESYKKPEIIRRAVKSVRDRANE